MNKERCNLCGVKESAWVDGCCVKCAPKSCTMTTENILEDKRIYAWREKQGLIGTGCLRVGKVSIYVQSCLNFGRKVPAYVLEFLAAAKGGK